MARRNFEHSLFVVLSRSSGIATRPELLEALKEADYPSYPEWLRRHLHTNRALSDEFVEALKDVAPDLTDQDWIEIFLGALLSRRSSAASLAGREPTGPG